MIANNYVGIMAIYHQLIDHGISGINIRHSMLNFLKKNSVVIYTENQENNSNNYVLDIILLKKSWHF